jgi:hypothetical protein
LLRFSPAYTQGTWVAHSSDSCSGVVWLCLVLIFIPTETSLVLSMGCGGRDWVSDSEIYVWLVRPALLVISSVYLNNWCDLSVSQVRGWILKIQWDSWSEDSQQAPNKCGSSVTSLSDACFRKLSPLPSAGKLFSSLCSMAGLLRFLVGAGMEARIRFNRCREGPKPLHFSQAPRRCCAAGELMGSFTTVASLLKSFLHRWCAFN